MAGSLSDGTTGLTRVTIGGLNSNGTSFGGLDLATFQARLSMQTYGTASGMTNGDVRLIFAASGLSLMYSSGKTLYTAGSSASAAQP